MNPYKHTHASTHVPIHRAHIGQQCATDRQTLEVSQKNNMNK